MAKIKQIKIGTADAYDIEDAEALHSIVTYNGGKVLGGKTATTTPSDISLADTPITETDITDLFTSK